MKNLEVKRAIAKKMKDGIETKGWNRKEFLAKFNETYGTKVTAPTLSKWLGGNHNFTVRTIFQIEKVLDITIILVTKSITND
jgi:transcriptional regulator with XRE-family HTH domain